MDQRGGRYREGEGEKGKGERILKRDNSNVRKSEKGKRRVVAMDPDRDLDLILI